MYLNLTMIHHYCDGFDILVCIYDPRPAVNILLYTLYHLYILILQSYVNDCHGLEVTPPTVTELTLPDNNNDPVTLSWTKPALTNDNREFFKGYDVSFSRDVFQTTLSQRSKINITESESSTTRLGPHATSHTFSIICPYSYSLTLCPYSQYCFSVVSVFEFRGTPIDVSDSTLTTMCTNTSEAGEFIVLATVQYYDMLCG